MTIKKLLLALVTIVSTLSANAQQLAFPGAEGWGRYAKGARAISSPSVYHVTNLNDSGSGSLRDAVSQGGRIVVFDVSGVINIKSRIIFASNIYVAGQTAPGEGITVYGDGVSFTGASNIICRYLRVRMGHGGSSGKDCAGASSGTNMIFDHCSFSWGLDETFSLNPDGKGALSDITIQNTIIGQGLMTHSAGGLIQADNITLYRNLYCDNSTRNNKVKGKSQYANNIVYNWKNGAYIMGGDSEGKSYVNVESNLFINGPAGGGDAFTGANADFHCYGNDNWQDSNTDGVFNPYEITKYSACTRESKPYDYPTLTLWSGKELLEKSLPMVGASLPYRDQSDYYMVDEVNSLGTDGALITYETALPIGAPNTWSWWTGEKYKDSDNDGMPDWWEEKNGTNPNSNDACKNGANGYLNIENYINSITAENRQYFLRKPITVNQKSSTTTTLCVSWRDYTFAEDGFAVEIFKDGAWKEMGRTAANATEYTVTGLDAGTSYKVRVRAFGKNNGSEAYSDYSTEVTLTTRPIEVGIIDIDSYVPNVTNSTEVTKAQKLLLNADAGTTLNYNLPSSIEPASVVVTGKGTVKISGSAISGGGTSMNRSNEGTLILNNTNSYDGATVNHGGVIEFNSIANGGSNSAIGASQAFAQNWIFDGGTYKYTGGNATTNRSARIDSDATFDISTATLTMTGKFEGKGGLTLDGKGTLNIADADFIAYDGATRLKGSTLNLTDIENACKKLGSSGKKIIMAGGALQFASKNEDYQELRFPIEIEDETTSRIAMPTHCYFKPVITGNGTLQFDLPYVRAYLDPNLSNFTGKLIGNGTKAGALFYNEKQWNAPQVRFELKGGVTLSSWASNAENVIGGLSGDAGTFLAGTSKQNKGFTCLWIVGNANSDETFSGVINNLPAGGNSAYSGTTSIKKVGTGLWRLNGNNVYSGATTIENGTLVVNGTNSGNGAISVSSGAELKGKGTLSGKVTASNGSSITAGDEFVDGSTLTMKGGLSLNTGSTLVIPVMENADKTLTANTISVTGNLVIGNGAILQLDMTRASGHEFKKGDAIRIIKNPSNISSSAGSFNIMPATPGEGLEWETSTLLSDGMLRVKNEGEQYEGTVTKTFVYSATLDHTASVQGGSAGDGKFLDEETHFYDNWGTVGWVAQVYAQFTFDIPEGDDLQKAELSLWANCGGKYDNRALDIYYLPVGAKKITSISDIPELSPRVGTLVYRFEDIIRNTYREKVTDVTNAISALRKEGQNHIIFVMSDGVAGGYIYGKKSTTYAPKLTITTTRTISTGIENINRQVTSTNANVMYDMSGRKVDATSAKKGIYIINGKKVVK